MYTEQCILHESKHLFWMFCSLYKMKLKFWAKEFWEWGVTKGKIQKYQ